MSPDLFDLPDPLTLAVVGEDLRYPVGRIFCVGRNYAAHAMEMGNEVDREAPFYFTKSAANAIESGAEVPFPQGTDDFHYEMELTVAIGGDLVDATPDTAAAAIFGYGCGLDMTRRDLQIRERKKQRPWDLGKDVENGCVLSALTPRSLWDVSADRRIWLELNDIVKQDARLGEMIWSVPDILCHLSTFYHLRAGDIILTGTPAGVGPVRHGDHLNGGIEGLAPVSVTWMQAPVLGAEC